MSPDPMNIEKRVDNLVTVFLSAQNLYGSRVMFDTDRFDFELSLARKLAELLQSRGESIFVCSGDPANLVICFGLTDEEAEPFYIFCVDEFDGMYYPQLGESELTGVN